MSLHRTPFLDGWGLILPEVIYGYCKRQKYSKEYADYWVEHVFDEALLPYGVVQPAGPPHHINTRGAHGNVDEPWNLISLSRENHRLVEQIGEETFCERFPMVAQKFQNARRLMKEKDGRTS